MGRIYNTGTHQKPKAEHKGAPHQWKNGMFNRRKCVLCGKVKGRKAMPKEEKGVRRR